MVFYVTFTPTRARLLNNLSFSAVFIFSLSHWTLSFWYLGKVPIFVATVTFTVISVRNIGPLFYLSVGFLL